MFSICAWCEEKSCEKENEKYPEWCMIPGIVYCQNSYYSDLD
ncbi:MULTISPECIES: hypothetical protein [unclassified Halanaerobium]|nr:MULTISPECIES: hypothetical protein [unclassified Halanaerobium]RCW48808.1 hypothetical protein DFR78_10791 [Halanaerobium sp. MA284_MarDTE_T2]RCW89150.1 hypothetical protein DER71_10292 [Halanaerobium sp. DL-01]